MKTATNLSDRSGGLVESHKNYDPRLVLFYFIIAGLLVVLVAGLAYQQLHRIGWHSERERQQNQRRVLVPGPRGNIYARDGRTILVGNRPRFSVVLYLDELKVELRREHIRIHDNFLRSEPKEVPSYSQLEQIARASVVQRYLDQVNRILRRESEVDLKALREHFNRRLLLPYTLLDDLEPDDYARLLERLPVTSPVQVYTSSTRFYPYDSAAAHTLGYVRPNEEIEAEDLPGEDLRTFKMKGTVGFDGLEKSFDSVLQGEAGGTVFRVDPAGFRINPPLAKLLPVQGKSLVTSLDIDLQLAAETAIGEQTGAAVALDVATGEVLALASKPDYNLNEFSPHATQAVVDDMDARNAWTNLALRGAYPPGSTFKILTSIAALRSGAVAPDDIISDCQGTMRVGTALKGCDNGLARHGEIKLREAIAVSCDIYYYTLGLTTTPEVIAAEARRFHLDQRTGIELPRETTRMTVPDPEWKQRTQNEKWFPGDTANMAIGQGYVLVTPLEMACFAASIARGEVFTKPTLLHQANRARQHTESIGLTPVQRAALIDGMIGCTTTTYTHSTASVLSTAAAYRIPGVAIAGKTGTAQKRVKIGEKVGTINFAWFICFAPAENPEIAVAVMLEGDTIGESFGGGANAGPVASMILKKYFEKKKRPAATVIKGITMQ